MSCDTTRAPLQLWRPWRSHVRGISSVRFATTIRGRRSGNISTDHILQEVDLGWFEIVTDLNRIPSRLPLAGAAGRSHVLRNLICHSLKKMFFIYCISFHRLYTLPITDFWLY